MPEPQASAEATSLSRRATLKRMVCGALAMGTLPGALPAAATDHVQPSREEEFHPENDYPFFGAEPPERKRHGQRHAETIDFGREG